MKFGDIVDIKMGQSPESSFYNNKKDGLPFYQGVTDFGEKYVKKSVYCSKPIKVAGAGDIFFSVRAPVGDINIATEKSCIGRGIASIKMRNGNNNFLYFLLKNYSKYFKGVAGGTTYESINKDQIEGIEFLIPVDSNEQKRIASILSAFDDKIELNNQINKNLEQTAQVIFQEWFVTFKFSGHEKVKMVDSELGKIPKDWKIGKIGDLLDVRHGYAFPSNKFKEEGQYPVIKIKNIKENNSIDLQDISYINLKDFNDSLAKFELNNGDILIAMTGATSGKIGLLTGIFEKYYLNQRVGKFQFSSSSYKWFSYIFLIRKSYRDLLLSFSDGSAQGNLSPYQIESIKLIIPEEKLLKDFQELVDNFYYQIINNILENQKLVTLRDLLLSKLVGGEIKV